MDNDGLHPDGFHEDQVDNEVHHGDFVFHETAAEFDHRDLPAVLANPFHGFDQDVSLFACVFIF